MSLPVQKKVEEPYNYKVELEKPSTMKKSPSTEVTHRVRSSVSMNKLRTTFSDASEVAHFTNESESEKYENLWKYCSLYLSKDVDTIKQQIANHIEYTLACQRFDFKAKSLFTATAMSLRDRMIEYWNDTHNYFTEQKVKRMYYLSIEYLIGRSLMNAICNLDLEAEYKEVATQFGSSLEELYEFEQDAALGSGGLGRLAACFLDSLATMNFPAWGYGIRYQYGMFKQQIAQGYQIETPEYWLEAGNPWEIVRKDVNHEVRFGGYVLKDELTGRKRWEGGSTVRAIACDMPVPGYKTLNTLNLRLWSSKPSTVFDLDHFNKQDDIDYWEKVRNQQNDESICKVLYPNSSNAKGQELRLKQQFFFTSASLQDIVRRFKKLNVPLSDFPQYVAIQLNDTHPTVGILELMRILVDLEGMEWNQAWGIVVQTFAYTNHTVLPEALETWTVPMFQGLLPRHMEIVYEINYRFLEWVKGEHKCTESELAALSIIEESTPKRIRMANLAIIGSHTVNGVAAIHSQIIKDVIFRHFAKIWSYKFINVTNGVTPRRWMLQCNPLLSEVVTEYLKTDNWVVELSMLKQLIPMCDHTLEEKFKAVKMQNKERLIRLISKMTDGDLVLNSSYLFDVMVKRIHEYKRQTLAILGTIWQYLNLKQMSREERLKQVPRVKIFAGKAATSYENAKIIVKLINSVAEVVNKDKTIDDMLKVVFIPNYSVSLAEVIVPANDINEQISTAGYEASGTSCMKFCMNGGLIIGTWDGANIEIAEEVGEENIFLFGAKKQEVELIRQQGPVPIDERLLKALLAISQGMFGAPDWFNKLIGQFWNGNDFYLVAADFTAYLKEQEKVDETWKKQNEWNHKCVMCTANMGKFSSDRSMSEYAAMVWNIQPCPLKEGSVEDMMDVAKKQILPQKV
ncbi:glycogen phosphorylase, putative [Entamoeba invadens IP1]|uniref:Alpha-1,4 glucan phosphorylase n=1 Tax=Entamoeba invadens IP1 TaxID=370355 RepID=A0A0A1U1A5_ENTIV|nr:glycogen phosphorylase, putative [Entamoeba invadens IP1]ELP87829.1 glycogen phosphorylase, putative [Entamoeba invadens IP1]|eukprot:XP_004254600.1 glycogen phosphorylase, putative [Entamoeba invadens IP1]